MKKTSFYISPIFLANKSYHNAYKQMAPPSYCLCCGKLISLDISYYHIEASTESPANLETLKFYGRVCSLSCADMFILSQI